MRYILLLTSFCLFSHAGVTDFLTLKEAKEAYAKHEYEKAAREYEKIAKEGSQEALFDEADALYKAGRYEDALKKFQAVKSPKLKFKKLYNIGNCYAHMGKIDEAIKAYEEALKIEEDENARYNLELLKKLKEKKRKDKKSKKNQKKNQNGSQDKKSKEKNGSGNGSKKESDNKKGSEKNRSDKKEKKSESRNRENRNGEKPQKSGENGKKQSEKKRSMTKEQKARQAQMRAEAQKRTPISDMEVRKWNKVLNQRGIPTLMLPLPTGKNRKRSPDETKPW
ncbi:tetratricopeptide repeat protein [Hydrogenimonas sp.]